MRQENWEEIPNSRNYAVSDKGRIKRLEHKKWNSINNSFSVFKEKTLSLSTNNTKGYCRIRIFYKDGTNIYCSIHRLVAEVFIPNPNNLSQINHLDGNKENNWVENLEWCTQTQNMQHRRETLGITQGLTGEKCNFTKLTEAQVKEIANLIRNGENQTRIAEQYNVKKTTITEIKKGRSWKHLNLF